jgi:predicted nucleotidyltransferase
MLASYVKADMMQGLSAELLNSDLLSKSRESSSRTRKDLEKLLSTEIRRYTSEDTSLVVFGSLGRDEWTSNSDLDWTFLIDGGANSDHLLIAQDIQKVFEKAKFQKPAPIPKV